MWQFSLREIVLVTTVFGIAMAVNVWNHRDLRSQLQQSQAYAREVEAYAAHLHEHLGYAQRESTNSHAQINTWLTTGELQIRPDPTPRWRCGSEGRYADPDWDVLKTPPPKRNSKRACFQ